MRRFLVMFAVAAVASLTVVTAAWAAAKFSPSNPPVCSGTTTVTCTGKATGLSNTTTPVYIVLIAPSGCSNNGNPDIQGQRAFTSGPFFADQGGNINFTTTYSASCPGNQTSFIGTPRTLELWVCTPGQSPRFQIDKKTGVITQTNSNCTLSDSASV